MTSIQHRSNASEIFAIVQQISSQINKDRIQEVVDKVNGLDINDKQLVVDLLGMALEKNHHLLSKADRVLLLLTKIASSANILARNRIISFERITPVVEQSPDLYTIPGEPLVHVRVMVRRGKRDAPKAFSERLITWAHLSHLHVLPIYGVFLEGEDSPISLVAPQMTGRNIVDCAGTLSPASRMLMISDVIDGLCYLHHLNIVHGRLTPQSVSISDGGRACITDLDAFNAEESDLCSIRYSAPEMLKDEEDPIPTQAADMWSLGSLIYEVLYGKVPFYQHRQERKVWVAILNRKQPTQPDREGSDAGEINDTIWRQLSACWEYQAEDRPTCPQFQKVFSSMITHDDRPASKPIITSEALEPTNGPAFNLDVTKSALTKILGPDPSVSSPSQIPDHLQGRLSRLVSNVAKAEIVARTASKLSPGDTQLLLDALDLIWEESSNPQIAAGPLSTLLKKIMVSTHIIPQRYKVNRIRYDPAPLVEGAPGKGYKGRDLDVFVSVVINPPDVSLVLGYLPSWAHSSHPNILPFYGVFHEDIDEIPRLCLVTPYMKNGLLCDYASRLPQKDRIPLICDVSAALMYLQGLNFLIDGVRADHFLVSDEGRVLLITFVSLGVQTLLAHADPIRTSKSHVLRFYAPERVINNERTHEAGIWVFGCLMYEVLSRKPPYHQYSEEEEIRSALSRKEVPKRPESTEDDIDEINDQFWNLIKECCAPEPKDRLTLPEIQISLSNMSIQDDRPEVTSLPGAEVLIQRSRLGPDWDSIKQLLDQIQVELLRVPLSILVQNHTKDVTAAAVKCNSEDIQILVDFLDLALKNHITLSDERNRVLALLSRITTSTHIFPNRYKLNGIKYHTSPIAEGGFGAVHRGVSDQNICVKVMAKVDSKALMGFVKELVLWAHSSHPNVLPFYGVFVDELKRICLVSPFMNKGNLHDYAPRLSQKKRIPLLHDIIKGLIYLHGLGVVHTDLKGENVLISDEGRGLITDFGASHVITATAKGGSTAASVASTLRFTAPEIVLNRHARPTQECDIWSLGCLFYEVLSRKLPYFEYNLDAQIIAALVRGQLPTRPGSSDDAVEDEQDWDELEGPDWDEIDDAAWSVVTSCWALKSEDRPKASRIEELIVDLKVWDDRPEAKDAPGIHLTKLRSNSDGDLGHVGELLDELQIRLLAQSTLRHSAEVVVLAISSVNFEKEDKWALLHFWDLVLKSSLFTPDEHSRALALFSTLTNSFWILPIPHKLSAPMAYNRVSLGCGSFGTVHQGSDPNLCIKVTNFSTFDSNRFKQWLKAVTPSFYVSHPNVLPLYGAFTLTGMGCLVSPFMRNGNLYQSIIRLSQTARVPLIFDVTEGIMYLHDLGIVHGNLKGENILISDEGRALVTDFRPYQLNLAAAGIGPTHSFVTTTLRFTAPELVKESEMLPSTKSDIWSIGCLIYLVFSRKDPFHQYSQDTEIRSALSRAELPERPALADEGTDTIDDPFWNLITKCCAPVPADRPTLLEIQKILMDFNIQDSRPPPKPFPGAEIIKRRLPNPGVDIERIKDILARIKAQLPPVTQNKEGEDETQD